MFFSDNAADAEIRGMEGDLVYFTDNGLILSGAFSLLDTEITKSLVPTADVVVGSDLAFAPGFQANFSLKKGNGELNRVIQDIGKLNSITHVKVILTSWNLTELRKLVML
ncbi:MAG: hypothetical protein Ct9H300mP20_04720 [Gammaproteobacteria bacterium]|nr:MAG: hypothetical protein Ct9H300mP20_04720 [Gammaproteobacteria bacterium]